MKGKNEQDVQSCMQDVYEEENKAKNVAKIINNLKKERKVMVGKQT